MFGNMTTFERKMQFGGYTKKRWKEIRTRLKKMWGGLTVGREAHNLKIRVRFSTPQQVDN